MSGTWSWPGKKNKKKLQLRRKKPLSLAADVSSVTQETRKTMEEMVGRGTGMVSVEIPFTPAAKRVLGDGVPWWNWLSWALLDDVIVDSDRCVAGFLAIGILSMFQVLEHYL